jgi:hypothetical protein
LDISKNFIWAVGIENTFIPHAKPELRSMDQFVLTQHDQQWQTDLELVTQTGAKYLRWGIPWYKVQPKPDQWDWAWVDMVLDEMVNQQKITPIFNALWNTTLAGEQFSQFILSTTRARIYCPGCRTVPIPGKNLHTF